jgi:hypothetical protein
MKRMPILILLLCLSLSPLADDSLSRHVYPMARTRVCPPVVVDATDFPEGKAWGEAARALVKGWYSTVCSLLSTDEFKPPTEIKLVIKKTISAPAYASGGTITINGKWITDHPDDLGMVIHELVHVVQQYPNSRNKPGWLVEGIADYIRWWQYEPELHATSGKTKINPEKSKYTDSYRTTAMWLAWCSRKYDMRLVPILDLSMRKAENPMPVFEKLTGKTAESLWKEFVESKP